MFRIIFYLFFVLLLACGRDKALQIKTINLDSGGATEVKLTLPEAQGNTKLAKAVNAALREEVISLLNFEDSLDVESLEHAVTSFHKGYENLRALYPDEAPGWKAEIFAEVTYEDEHWVSIQLNAYIFTGGAHGYGSVRFLNFDKHKGTELQPWQLFSNQGGLRQLAESRFRQQEDIPENQPINSTGFMFEENRFSLPENIGLTQTGVTLHYNQYEVASYADGPIELTLPFTEVRKFMNYPGKS